MIQAIFFDVDGTLLSLRTHRIPDSTIRALHRLREKGIKLFVSTGRHMSMLDKEHEGVLMDRASHLKATRWHPTFPDALPPNGGKDVGIDQADYVTCSVDEDGVAAALEHVHLI